jgi:hypothetical protein
MRRTKRVIWGVLVGGLVGALAPGLLAYVMAREDPLYPRFLLESLLWLGGGGLVGGALSGLTIGARVRIPSQVAFLAAIVGVVAGLAGCSLSLLGNLVYASTPWPVPKPYPGVQTHQRDLCEGSWGCVHTSTYTVTLGLPEIEDFYSWQMRLYCVEDWVFKPATDSSASQLRCQKAECRIRRPGSEQFFTARLCPVSGNETYVEQRTDWKAP